MCIRFNPGWAYRSASRFCHIFRFYQIEYQNKKKYIFKQIFSLKVLGYMSERTGIEVSDLAVGGPGLSFIGVFSI